MARTEPDVAAEPKPAIVYTGTADVRVISKEDVEGLERDLVWSNGNDFSVSTDGLADDAVEFLRHLPDFKVK